MIRSTLFALVCLVSMVHGLDLHQTLHRAVEKRLAAKMTSKGTLDATQTTEGFSHLPKKTGRRKTTHWQTTDPSAPYYKNPADVLGSPAYYAQQRKEQEEWDANGGWKGYFGFGGKKTPAPAAPVAHAPVAPAPAQRPQAPSGYPQQQRPGYPQQQMYGYPQQQMYGRRDIQIPAVTRSAPPPPVVEKEADEAEDAAAHAEETGAVAEAAIAEHEAAVEEANIEAAEADAAAAAARG